jgi:hypothetical protein
MTLKASYDDKGPFSSPTSFQELGIFIICICKPSKRELLLRVTTLALYLFPLSFLCSLSVHFIEQVTFPYIFIDKHGTRGIDLFNEVAWLQPYCIFILFFSLHLVRTKTALWEME